MSTADLEIASKIGMYDAKQEQTSPELPKTRNDSLHADWANVQHSQVQSCIGFIEPLLVKHFS